MLPAELSSALPTGNVAEPGHPGSARLLHQCASRCLLARSDPSQGWGKTVLTSHSGSWDLLPAPSWHQNLLDKSWRSQAKVAITTVLLVVHPSPAAAGALSYHQLLLTPSHCSSWHRERYSHSERAGR